MSSFGTDARRKVLVSRDSKLEDEDMVLEMVADRFVKYFKCVFHRNTWYFAQFVCCKYRQYCSYKGILNHLGEILNFALLLIQFVETDKFLNGKFAFYGLDTIKYLSLTRAEKLDQM